MNETAGRRGCRLYRAYLGLGPVEKILWKRNRDFLNRRRNVGRTQRSLPPDAEQSSR
jgi:hypothetical protein